MRMQFSILFLLALLAQISMAQNEALKKVSFLPSWAPQSQFAGYYMAREKGIYAKYGLDVNIINGRFDKDVAKYLKDGKVDFGTIQLSSAIIKRDTGLALVNIGQILQQCEIMFVARKKSGINSLKDFGGKKIAIWRTAMEELTMGFLNDHKIEAEVIKINDGVNIFMKDAVDICVVMHYNEYNNLINYGLDPDDLNLFYLKDYGMNFPEDGIYCMSDTYEKDPELCAKFVRASVEGWIYSLAHPEETLEKMKIFQKQENIVDNTTHSGWMLKSMSELIKPSGKKSGIGELNEDAYNQTVQFLLRNNYIKAPVKFNDFYRGTIKK